MINITLPGEPIPKLRPRFSRKGTYDPQSSQKHAAKFQILSQIDRSNLPFYPNVAIEIRMNFYFSIPKGEENLFYWGILDHIDKPDYDNLEKWILDCLSGIVYSDDRQVNISHSKKYYCETPRTDIYIMPKKSNISEEVREVLNTFSPEYINEFSEMISFIAECNPASVDHEKLAFLILEFAEIHAEPLKKLNKKFPGFSKVLKKRMENK